MPGELCWYFEKEELRLTPSYFDGIDSVQEARHRRTGARFILCLGGELGMKHDACATAVVFFHRFYMSHSFKDMPLFVVGACCLFLAGKVEETPKKCHNIVKVAQGLLPAEQWEQFQSNPAEEVMALERVLLKTIRFDLQVQHPYKYLVQFAKKLKIESEQLNVLVQTSWTFINDSLATSLCLQWEPEVIACAVIYLSLKMKQMEIKDWQGRTSSSQRWWEAFVEGMTVEVMEDVCHQILDLFSEAQSDDATLFATAPKFTRNDGRGTHWRENAHRIRAEHPEMVLPSRALLGVGGGFADGTGVYPKQSAPPVVGVVNAAPASVGSTSGAASLGYPVLNQSNQAAAMAAFSSALAGATVQPYPGGFVESGSREETNSTGLTGYPVTAAVLQNSNWLPPHLNHHSNEVVVNKGAMTFGLEGAYPGLPKQSHI